MKHRPKNYARRVRERRRKLAASVGMADKTPVHSGLPRDAGHYAFGSRIKGSYRDIMTGQLMLVRTAADEHDIPDWWGIQRLRETNKLLLQELSDSENARSELEKAIPLQKSVKATGEKMIGYVVSDNPTKRNRKKGRESSDAEVTESLTAA